MSTTQACGPLAVQAIQWTQFPHINSMEGLTPEDAACLRDVRDVLAKHDRLERFGLSLLHKHFELSDDEVLVETTSVATRSQMIAVAKLSDYATRDDVTLVPTMLKLVDGDEVIQACVRCEAHRAHAGHPG